MLFVRAGRANSLTSAPFYPNQPQFKTNEDRLICFYGHFHSCLDRAATGRIQYDSSSTSYTSSNSFIAGTSCTGLNSASLLPNYQTGPSSAYTAVAAGAAQQGTWFPGVPCNVTVTGSGCYLAWSNATHYYEEGNYVLPNMTYVPGCPDCSRATASSNGTCRYFYIRVFLLFP
jgi:hypothetical protein